MGEEGAPTLSAEATPTNDALALDFADKAMTAVFGANWRDTVVMEYDEWAKANYLPTKADAEAVAASSYYQKNSPAELISSFTDLTGALAGMANTAGQDPLTTMASIPNFMSSDEISAMRNQLDDLDVSWDKDKEAYTTAVSNLLVQNAATEISNLQPGGTMSAVSQMAANYALIYGWGSSTEEGAAVLAELNATLTNPNTNSGQAVEAVRSAYDQFMVNGGTYLEGGQGTADGAALQVIMGTVSDWSADADMTTAGLYSSDSIADAVNNYMAAVDAMDSMGENAPELVNALNKAGCIVVFIASNGKTGCNISIS